MIREAIAKAAHLPVEFLLARVGEWRMPDVVRECERLGEILVEPQCQSHCSCNLRDLDRMGQPVAEVVGQTRREYLSFLLCRCL